MNDIYERVRQRLDMFPQGFPKTASGVELDILRRLFTPDEGEVMLAMRPFPEPASAIAERLSRNAEELGKELYGMSKKGVIMRTSSPENQILYSLVPWIVGIWEFQLNNLDPEFVRLKEKYTEEGMIPERRKSQLSGMRTIPVEEEIASSSEIEPYEKVSEILNAHTKFAVAECLCRKTKKILGDGCGKLLEACLIFGSWADYYVENGLGRGISRDEAQRNCSQGGGTGSRPLFFQSERGKSLSLQLLRMLLRRTASREQISPPGGNDQIKLLRQSGRRHVHGL